MGETLIAKKKFILLDQESNNEVENEESFLNRLFFHDVINHTHGLLLFLNQKEIQNKNFSKEDYHLLKNEIKTLQNLLKDHFKMGHKNLIYDPQELSSEDIKKMMTYLISIYLPSQNVNFSFDVKDGDEKVFYFSSKYIYRICSNLLKNISEALAHKKESLVQISLAINSQGLVIETHNSLPHALEKDLPEYLEKIILDEATSKFEGLGIESINNLTNECHGTFQFEIIQNDWVNKIFLPHTQNRKTKDSNLKKVA